MRLILLIGWRTFWKLCLAVILVTAITLAIVDPSRAEAVNIGSWTGIAYTPTCSGGYYGLWATCQGSGAIIAYPPDYPDAWNQATVCADQLVTGGWQHMGCLYYPTSPNWSNFNGGDAPRFQMSACGRWYSTYVSGRVLLVGGWYQNSGRSPGIQVRC